MSLNNGNVFVLLRRRIVDKKAGATREDDLSPLESVSFVTRR